MRLNLREIIASPGSSIPFEYQLNLSDMNFGLSRCVKPIEVSGQIVNSAGVLTLSADLNYELSCICDRCAAEFIEKKQKDIEAVLADTLEDEENLDFFLLDGDYADLDEIITTAFILGMDSRHLCKEDCKGLCPQCGANLNDGPCTCKKAIDPRLAVLEQLLDG